jgi:hypothetical protein
VLGPLRVLADGLPPGGRGGGLLDRLDQGAGLLARLARRAAPIGAELQR